MPTHICNVTHLKAVIKKVVITMRAIVKIFHWCVVVFNCGEVIVILKARVEYGVVECVMVM